MRFTFQIQQRFCPCKFVFAWAGFAVCLAIGCNSDPSYRRETALLRAEILDWEDKYALLKARYEENAAELAASTGQPIESTMIPSSGNYQGRIMDKTIDAMYAPGTVLPDGAIVVGEPVTVQNGVIVEHGAGQIWDPNTGTFIDRQMTTNPTLTNPAQTQPRTAVDPSSVIREPENLPQALPAIPQGTEQLPASQNESNNGSSLPMLRGNVAFNRQISSRRRLAAAITEVVINRDGTRGHSVDPAPGDEGLNLLIQPRSSNGQVILEPGELTVSVIDPKEPSASKRVGLWKFLPEESELFFVNDELASQGILLKLPWDQATPKRSKLMVHVRYVTADGRVLKTSSGVRIKPPSPNYSSEAPEVVQWSQQDWRWSANEAGDAWIEDPSVFNLNLPAEGNPSEVASEDVFAPDVDRDWKRANGSPRRTSSINSNGFRIRGSQRNPINTEADSRKPQWRPVR